MYLWLKYFVGNVLTRIFPGKKSSGYITATLYYNTYSAYFYNVHVHVLTHLREAVKVSKGCTIITLKLR